MSKNGNGEGTITQLHRGHHEGSISERKNKCGDVTGYQAQVTVPGGRRSQTFKTEREARRWIRETQVAAASGRMLAKRSPTLSAYLSETWLPGMEDRVKSRTRVSYRLAAGRVPAWLADVRLDELKPAHFQRFYAELTTAKKAPRTVRQTHMVLHKALQDALPLDLVLRNPTEGARLPRIPQTEMNWYSDQQLAHLFYATEGDRFHALWVVLGTLGLRLGEALGLRWDDIDWERGTVSILRKLERDRERGTLVLNELKTKSSKRTLRLGRAATVALQAHQDRQDFARKRAAGAWQEQGLVFCTVYGGPLDQTRIHEHWTPTATASGLPRYRIHDLRHSVASNLLQAGFDMMKVAQMLGHRNATMVLQVYGHLLPDAHQEAAGVMDALLDRHAAAR